MPRDPRPRRTDRLQGATRGAHTQVRHERRPDPQAELPRAGHESLRPPHPRRAGRKREAGGRAAAASRQSRDGAFREPGRGARRRSHAADTRSAAHLPAETGPGLGERPRGIPGLGESPRGGPGLGQAPTRDPQSRPSAHGCGAPTPALPVDPP